MINAIYTHIEKDKQKQTERYNHTHTNTRMHIHTERQKREKQHNRGGRPDSTGGTASYEALIMAHPGGRALGDALF